MFKELHPLVTWGANPQEANFLNRLPPESKLNYLKSQLDTYELHVVRNHVVSLPYYYWMGEKGEVFSDQQKKIKLEVDEKERDGFSKMGTEKAINLVLENPNQLVFWYSPSGPASFKNPPDPEYAKPYNIGQFYIMWRQEDKIKNIAISINNQGESWLKEVFGKDYWEEAETLGQIERIKYFLSSPQATDFVNIDDFLNYSWSNQDLMVFKNFSLNDGLKEIRNSLIGKLRSTVNNELIAARLVSQGGSHISQEKLLSAYQSVIYQIMDKEGLTKLKLGGGCGGSEVRKNGLIKTLFDYFPVLKLESLPNLSSEFRKLLNNEEIELHCPACCWQGQGDPCGECPGCHRTVEEIKNYLSTGERT